MGGYSTFEYDLDMSSGSVYAGTTITLTLEQSAFGGIFALSNVGAGNKVINQITNFTNAKWECRFYKNSGAGTARFNTAVGGVKLNTTSPANTDLLNKPSFIILQDIGNVGTKYEQYHSIY